MMPLGVVGGGEVDLFHQQHHQGIADDGHHGGGGGGGEAQGTHLGGMAGVNNNLCHAGKETFRIAGEDDQGQVTVQSAGQFHQLDDLSGLARIGDQQQYIVGLDHPQVAVLCLAGMQENGRCAGGGESGGNVDAYLARLAHAAGDHLASLPVYPLVNQ